MNNFQHQNWDEERVKALAAVLDHALMFVKVHDTVSAMEAIEQYALGRKPPAPVEADTPRRFRWKLEPGDKHPNGTDSIYRYGSYFPKTQLRIYDMGERGTGKPKWDGVEWIDPEPPH